MNKIDEWSNKLPYSLQGSFVDPAVWVFVIPLLVGYGVVALVGMIL